MLSPPRRCAVGGLLRWRGDLGLGAGLGGGRRTALVQAVGTDIACSAVGERDRCERDAVPWAGRTVPERGDFVAGVVRDVDLRSLLGVVERDRVNDGLVHRVVAGLQSFAA